MTTPAPALTLEVTSQQAGALGVESRKTFGVEGGTIGRATGNRWVLADDYVSSRHAAIRFLDGGFCIEDLNSTNGVYVNDRRIEIGQPCLLRPGDRVFIEPFEMVASVISRTDEPQSPAPRSAVAAARRPADPPAPSEPSWTTDLVPAPSSAPGGDDWLNALAPPAPASARPEAAAPPRLGNDPRNEHVPSPVFPPPAVADAAVQIPAGYNPLRPGPRASAQEPVKAGAERRLRERRGRDRRSAAAATPAGGPDLAAVLAGAGLEGVSVTPDVARQFGQILRVVVTGVLDVLRARQEVRGEFRIRPTIMQRRRNNPLKHSTDADDALHNLLLKKSPGYLGPVEAFEDAFKDLRNHQLAMLAGVRVAFEAMFSHFDPERLQREFDRHTPKARRGALAALQGKPDYWDFYRDWVQRLSQDADGTFRTLFGHEFAKAYEDQLDRLKAQSPASAENGGNGDRVRGR